MVDAEAFVGLGVIALAVLTIVLALYCLVRVILARALISGSSGNNYDPSIFTIHSSRTGGAGQSDTPRDSIDPS